MRISDWSSDVCSVDLVELVVLSGLKDKRPVRCVSEMCTKKAINGIQWRPGGDEVLFTVTDPHEGLGQSIFRWNVGSGQVRPVVRARGLLSGGRDRSSNCGVSAEADRKSTRLNSSH